MKLSEFLQQDAEGVYQATGGLFTSTRPSCSTTSSCKAKMSTR